MLWPSIVTAIGSRGAEHGREFRPLAGGCAPIQSKIAAGTDDVKQRAASIRGLLFDESAGSGCVDDGCRNAKRKMTDKCAGQDSTRGSLHFHRAQAAAVI